MRLISPVLVLLACLGLALPGCKKEVETVIEKGEDVVIDRAALAKPADHPGIDAPAAAGEAAQSANGDATEVTLEIAGLHCEQDCVPRVQAMLEHAPGVESVSIDYATKTASVKVRKGTQAGDVAAAVVGGFAASAQ